MENTTKTMLATFAATVFKRGLLLLAAYLSGHGLLAASGTQAFVEAGVGILMGLASLGYDWWNNYGQAIITAKLEVWKAKALAQQEALRRAKVPEPSHAEIADKAPAEVTPAVVAKVVAAGCVALLIVLASPALAQQGQRQNLGPIGTQIKDKIEGQGGQGGPTASLAAAVKKLVEGALLPDLKVASARAEKRGNKVTKPCWDAVIEFIEQAKAPDDTPVPDPHIVTAIEDLIDFHDSIQPGAPLMMACAPLKEKLRMDTRTFFLTLASGGIAAIERALTGGLL